MSDGSGKGEEEMYKEFKGSNKKKIVSRFTKKNRLIMEFQLEDEANKETVEKEIKKMIRNLNHLLPDGISYVITF